MPLLGWRGAPSATKRSPCFAGFRWKRSQLLTPQSRSKCGCPSKAGTENYRARAMEDLPGRSATLDLDLRCNKDMWRWARTRAILQAERMRAGLWDTRRRWQTLATAESMR